MGFILFTAPLHELTTRCFRQRIWRPCTAVRTGDGGVSHTHASDAGEFELWVVVLLPLVVSGLMAGFKVGELAAMLVSGSGAVGSGMMAFVIRGGRRATAASDSRSPASGG